MLLEKFRELIKGTLAKVILALITIPFALWGIESYIRTGPSQDTVATVAGQRITYNEFDQTFKNQQEQYRQMLGANYDAAMFNTAEARSSVLEQLVNQRVVQQAATRSKVRVSDELLREKILTEPAFQVDGTFNQSNYDLAVKRQFGSAARFEEQLRGDLQNDRFRTSILDTGFISKTSVDQFARLSEQTRDVSVLTLSLDAYKDRAKIEPKQVQEYYDNNKGEFTIPEQVKVEYIEVSIDAIAAATVITPEKIAETYNASKDRYRQKEERKASHILISAAKDAKPEVKKAAREKAQQILDTVRKNPATFADIAKKESQDPGSAATGGDLGFFGRGSMVGPFEAAAFGAQKEEIVGPVETDFGFHIIRVTDIKPEKVKSLEEARPEIEGEMKKAEANAKFADVSQKVTDIVFTQPNELGPAAQAAGVPLKTSPLFARQFAPVPALNNPKLLGEIFSADSLKSKRNTSAVEVRPNVLVAARVIESKPSEIRPFDTVKASIEARLIREAQTRLAKEEGEAKLKAAQEGKAGITWPADLAVSREKPGGLPPDLVDKIMRAETKTLPAFVGGPGIGGGFAVVRISKVNEVVIDSERRKQIADRIRQTQQQGEFMSLLNSLKLTTEVALRKDVLEKNATPRQ
jgi:peptidyl-prolyl cis-trans isomerase D